MPARGHWLSSLYRDATISHEALVLQISRLTILAGSSTRAGSYFSTWSDNLTVSATSKFPKSEGSKLSHGIAKLY